MADEGYPFDTWYGRNEPHRVISAQPPPPLCVDCDAPLDDLEPGSPHRCSECQLLVDDDQARRLWNRQHGFPEDGSYR